jgi:hypothetical protein
MLDPAAGSLVVGSFALLFASAALHKLRAPARLTEVLRAYRIVPEGALGLSWLVAGAELGTAAGLLLAPVRPLATVAGAALLALYAAAIALNLARGRRELACGCGGADEERPIAGWMVGRNLALALLLAATLVPWGSRAMLPTDALTVAGGTAVAALLYMSVDRLLGRVLPRTAELRGPR